jgi:FkbM family methyltransferase
MPVQETARAVAKKLLRAYADRGHPLLPVTRHLRGPLRWLYHRSPTLRHDSRFYWRPNLLLGLHELLVRDHPTDFPIYDGRIQFRSTGSAMSLQGYYVGEIERHLVDFIVSQLRPGFTMLDVGAHHGVFTVVVAHELRAHGWPGQVHSFEPDPVNHQLLAHNVERNGLGATVTLHHQALSSAPGEDDLIGTEGENSGNTLASTGEFAVDPQGAKLTRRVEVATLDGLVEAGVIAGPVHLIKMDIQGAEPMALAGGARLIERDRPIIAVEAAEGWPSSERTRAFLLERGYRLHGLTRDGRPCAPGSPEVFVSWDCIALPE